MAEDMIKLLSKAYELKASDLHLNVGVPPIIRVDGKLQPMNDVPLTGKEIEALGLSILPEKETEMLKKDRELDLSIDVEGVSRFRANFFWQMDTLSASFRAIPHVIPSSEELGLPEVALTLADLPRGLVIVTGPTGSGKSTTLAAMIDHINSTRSEHIITVEDPIEYLHKQKKSVISQREVGHDTLSFTNALKYALRQDPDVVLVGEMRDLNTVQSTITIAETGHLVLATLHTNSAVEAIDRMIDIFPPHQQNQVRTQLSFILQGVLTQQLLAKIGGGRALAMEVLIPNAAVRTLIREGKTHQVLSQMQMGQGESKMITMDQALSKLVKSGMIDKETALKRASDKESLIG
ncbi:MAG: PilT/PilU family type 4a pilus ATPase [Pseudomonadota bacterium]